MLPKHLFVSGLIVAIFVTTGAAVAREDDFADRWDKTKDRGDEIAEGLSRTLNADVFEAVKALDAQLVPLYEQGKYAQALPIVERQLKLQESRIGIEHRNTLRTLENLATLHKELGHYGEAERLYRRALETHERAYGKDDLDIPDVANKLAMLYRAMGRYADAEGLYLRAIRILKNSDFKFNPPYEIFGNLALLYEDQGRDRKAEEFYRRAIEEQERNFDKDDPVELWLAKDPKRFTRMSNLASFLGGQGRYGEAEQLFRRALERQERALGKDHPDTLGTVNNIAVLYQMQDRYAEAALHLERALRGFERAVGKDHPTTLAIVSNLALLNQGQDRYEEAEPLARRALEARERTLGKDHPDTLTSVNILAAQYRGQGSYAEAEALQKRVIAGLERKLGSDHPNTIDGTANLAEVYFAQSDWGRATQFWQRSTDAVIKRTLRGARDARMTGTSRNDAERWSSDFSKLVKASYRLASDGSVTDATRVNQTFQTAQWALSSEAAKSLVQMAARGAAGNPKLAALIRERQDLTVEWQNLDARRNASLSQVEQKRSKPSEDANQARISAIDKRIAVIDGRMAADFPNYASLISPSPLAIEETQALLGPDEALVLFLNTEALKPVPEETFIWVMTKTEQRWARSALGTKALQREVQALRCELDAATWAEPACVEVAGQNQRQPVSEGIPSPFDLARAHDLYKALFGPVEDLIRGKHLLVVASGPLTQLPFQVLVKTPAKSSDYRSAAWLVRDHAVTVLPAVSSLRALRRTAHRSSAVKPMIGFGNPLLDGPQGQPPQFDAQYKRLAQLARDNQHCRALPSQPAVASLGLNRGITPMERREGLAQVSQIRALVPLPETADELCGVARDLRVEGREIRLGASATEKEVKRLSASGELAQYRIVHFATHGALAGQVNGSNEPGLILTPPAVATANDDGYLSASEIAALKLDADWVVLSACNTAAGGATTSQALSGLARAFIYAQAHALLVSHWEVNSKATVKLITTAMTEMATDGRVGRAEALRRAMLTLVDKGSAFEAHPSNWAPFIVVGEGAR
jgi:CHAT domain-containing protein/tetratricopeptide (TPR) repeat protein